MRNLLGLGAAVVCGYCGRAPPPPTGTAARLCLETRPRPPHRSLRRPPHRSLRHPPHRSLRHPPHGWGLVSCWRAPTLPHVRYKILPAQLLGGDNGTKLSLHVEKAPNRAISGEQGEFCTGSRAVRLVLGEFCTAHAVGRGVLGEFCTGSRAALGSCCWAFPLMGTGAGPSGPAGALHDGGRRGFCTTRSPLTACRRRVAPSCSAIPPVKGPA